MSSPSTPPVSEEPTRVAIDLNVRTGTGGQLTFTGFEDTVGDAPVPRIGTSVLACETESGIEAPAIVVDRNDERRLLYLAVAWREFRDMPDREDDRD
jgi:hypothetical protein